MTTEDGTVYVRTHRGGSLTLHTDPNCRKLALASTVRERPRETLPADAEWCEVCTGGYEPYRGGGSGLHERLVEADPDSVAASGGGE